MKKDVLIQQLQSFVARTPENSIDESWASESALVGTRMYEDPLVTFGNAADPLFLELKKEEVVGPHALLPTDWLPEARTVISVFLPISEELRATNRKDKEWPSKGWLYARIEGQNMINSLSAFAVASLEHEGYKAVAPSIDSRRAVNEGALRTTAAPTPETSVVRARLGGEEVPAYSSNWSERHVAFICGQGTFGLSKGLITARGVAGRFTSIITDLPVSYDDRPYKGIYEYCSSCGVCAKNCPADAISIEHGKDHEKCAQFLRRTREKFSPRYGCGKCQTHTPCEARPCKPKPGEPKSGKTKSGKTKSGEPKSYKAST